MRGLARMMITAPWRRGPATAPRETETEGVVVVSREGSVRRMAQKYPHLLPADSSADSFDVWLAATGTSVPVEELADLYADICLLAGWALPEPIQIDVLSDSPAEVIPDPMPVPVALPGLTKLTAADAARRFRDWLFECRRDGTYTSAEVSALYEEHCRAEDLIPHPENEMRPHLQRLGGVKKAPVDINVKTKDGKRRNRSVRWIFKAPASFLETVPWPELPDWKEAA